MTVQNLHSRWTASTSRFRLHGFAVCTAIFIATLLLTGCSENVASSPEQQTPIVRVQQPVTRSVIDYEYLPAAAKRLFAGRPGQGEWLPGALEF